MGSSSSSSFLLLPSSVGKQSQLLLQPTEVELGLQVGVEFDNIANIQFLWGGGGWCLQSHFLVKPNRCVEVRLGLGF